MRLHVLGCSGAETPGRNLSAFLFDGTLLLDAGTIGAVLPLENQKLIRDILISHAHLDHVRAIPFFADNLAAGGFPHTVSVHGMDEVLQALRQNLFNGLLWPDFSCLPSPGKPVLRFQRIPEGEALQLRKHRVTAYALHHKTPSLGFLVEDEGGKRILYAGDTGPTEYIWTACRENAPDAAIIEVTYPNRLLDTAIQSGHLTPDLLSWELRKMKKPPRKFLITHLKPFYLDEIVEELIRAGIEGMEILQDGQVMEF
ncbi:MAG: 3',5'-cyclic-nucleotide phosphodiesterase [Proteobacteria bacterium]|nr:3',5'-cyclic-nucleotide phosphodiesterase [Pseudomonadota bacterium]